jgi:hypothetical protein
MPPPPSATDQRLRQPIAERMRMSHVVQPLMLMELLGRCSGRLVVSAGGRRPGAAGIALGCDGDVSEGPATV